MNKIPGRRIAKQILTDIKSEVENLDILPKLAIIQVGDDEATDIYVKYKIKDAKKAGLDTQLHKFDRTSFGNISDLINNLNCDPAVTGILVQLPLPIDGQIRDLLKQISLKKDVDGLNPISLGEIWQREGEVGFLPATVEAILECIKYVANESNSIIENFVKGKNIVIVNDSVIVGRPLAGVLLNFGATVVICHEYTSDLKEHLKNADIIISATGKQDLIQKQNVKDNAVLVDVGIVRRSNGKVTGDVDLNSFEDSNCWVTPVPGGVGPLTRAMLLSNVLKAHKLHF